MPDHVKYMYWHDAGDRSDLPTANIVDDVGLRGSLEERFESTGNDATPAPAALDPKTNHSDGAARDTAVEIARLRALL